MAAIERAISIRQPYCDQILRGIKLSEYRSRRTNLRERVYLYASLTPGDREDWDDHGYAPGELPAGVIVGSVEIIDCRWNEELNTFGWKLARPRRLRSRLKPTNQPQPGIWQP